MCTVHSQKKVLANHSVIITSNVKDNSVGTIPQ
jgi:hypothetical protein